MARSMTAASVASVERFPALPQSNSVTDELNAILSLLRQAFGEEHLISFDFDVALHVHIDVRKKEEVTLVQAILPTLGAGLFYGVALRGTPNRPFYHRISALVAR